MRIVLFFYLICATCWAQITQVHTMEEVMERFKDGDRTTFAVFDIDMVLIQPDDPAFQMVNIEKYAPIAKRIILSVPPEKRDILFTLTALHLNSVLVDNKTPSYLAELHGRGIPTFALTASLTGSLLHIPSLETWKSGHLQQQGIFFEKGGPYDGTLVFSELNPYRGHHPKFTEGVLFSNGALCSKGTTLVTFLRSAGLSPKAIIFVDDKVDNLRSVEEALLAFDPTIKFEGLHFLGARYYPTDLLTEEEFTSRWEEVAAHALEID